MDVPGDNKILRRRAMRVAIIVVTLFVGTFVVNFLYFRGRPFDAAEWQAKESMSNGLRQGMADRLLARGDLDKKSRAEVKAMLGEPTEYDGTSRWKYFLGHTRSLRFVLFGTPSPFCDWFTVDFGDDNRVSGYCVGSSTNCGWH
jgi:hypothetical protein